MLAGLLARHRLISLALQGGGAHGAFTWGVLDALLEDGGIRFDGVSGTSAGAMNAVVLAQGLMSGGLDGARESLERFWNSVGSTLPAEMTIVSPDGRNVTLAPLFRALLNWTNYFSPTQLNPFNLDPLGEIVRAQIDFEQLRRRSPVRLFIAATHANSGKLRMFRERELSAEAVLASACLPTVHRGVEIDGETYWDGGYAANPAVFPLFLECASRDILLVLLAPLKHAQTPSSAKDIRERLLEIAFNATFLREMRMVAHLRDRVGQSWYRVGRLERRVTHMNFHVIEAAEVLIELHAETKLAANLRFFEMLKELGRERAKNWLRKHRAHIGRRSTVDLSSLFY